MYRKILVALENSTADEALLPHVAEMARLIGAELFLVHVADGWVARNFETLKLVESEEMKRDRAYLEDTAGRLRGQGFAPGDAPEGEPLEERAPHRATSRLFFSVNGSSNRPRRGELRTRRRYSPASATHAFFSGS